MPLSNPAPISPWRARLVPGHLLPCGRFAWWYALLGLLLLVLGAVGVGFVEYAWGVWMAHSPWQYASLLLYAPLFIATALLTPWLASRRLEAADFPAPKGLLGWHIGMVIGMTIAIQIVVNAFEALVPGARAASEEVALSLGLGASVISDVALVLAVAVLAALGEEWLFRGLFFRSLRDGLARWLPLPVTSGLGALISSALFAVVHVGDGQITQWPALFLMGVLLALTYEWTGSLLAPMLVHTLNNTLALFVMQDIPGVQFSHPGLLVLAAVSPLLLLVMGRFLLRLLPGSATLPWLAGSAPALGQAQTTRQPLPLILPPPLPQPSSQPDGPLQLAPSPVNSRKDSPSGPHAALAHSEVPASPPFAPPVEPPSGPVPPPPANR